MIVLLVVALLAMDNERKRETDRHTLKKLSVLVSNYLVVFLAFVGERDSMMTLVSTRRG
jgi:putative Ca2+/H+ antiporter (TMEM165/GDT1 family)